VLTGSTFFGSLRNQRRRADLSVRLETWRPGWCAGSAFRHRIGSLRVYSRSSFIKPPKHVTYPWVWCHPNPVTARSVSFRFLKRRDALRAKCGRPSPSAERIHILGRHHRKRL